MNTQLTQLTLPGTQRSGRERSACTHCRQVALEGTWCCDQAELRALRGAVDQAITALDSEVRGPLCIDDGGAVREVARLTSSGLKKVRRVA